MGWTVLYKLSGSVSIIIAFNALVLGCGTWVPGARCCGMCLNCCMSCALFASVIVTGAFRYNTIGQLAALSQQPAWVEDYGNTEFDWLENYTYEHTSKLVTALFSLYFVLCCAKCMHAGCLGHSLKSVDSSPAYRNLN